MGSYNYYNPSSSNSAYIGKFAIAESNDINSNSSTIHWTFSLYRNDSYQSSYSRQEGNLVVVSINGSEVFRSAQVGTVKAPNGEGNAYVLASGSTVVGHNSDGTKTFAFSARYTNSYSSSISPLEVSGNHVCNGIPRGSSFTIASSSLDIGQTQSYNITRYSSAFLHRISMTVKNANNEDVTVFLQDGVGTTLTATVPWKIVEYMYAKNLTSATVTTHMLTYQGSINNIIGGMSKTFTARIPAAPMSLSSSSIAMGSSTAVRFTRYSSKLNYKINFSFGSLSSQIATLGVDGGSSYTFTPSVSTYAPQIPSSKSGTGTITVYTYSGSALVGSSSASLTLSLPSNLDYTPVFDALLSTSNTYNGCCLKNKSKISGSFSNVVLKNGANIRTQRITVGQTVYDRSFSNVLLTSAGTHTITYYLEDTRGYSKTLTKTVKVYDYESPKITALQIARDPDAATKCSIHFNASYFKPSGGTYTNTATVKLSYGSTVLTLAAYNGTSETAGIESITFSEPEIKVGSEAAIFSTEKAYTFQLEIYDTISGNAPADTKTAGIQSLFYLMDFNKEQGIAFGKGSTGNGFEVNFDGHFYKKLEVTDTLSAKNGVKLSSSAQITADNANALNLSASGGIKENGTLLSQKYAASAHSHSYLPTSGGSVNGSISVSGSISEGGKSLASKYAASSHSHSYLPLSGGTMSGNQIFPYNYKIHWNASNSGGRIYCSQNQRMYFGASSETNYYIYYGVLDNRWALCPDVSTYMSLGSDSKRWDQVFAKSGTINTSDRNEKKEIKDIDVNLAKSFIQKLSAKTYKFIESTSGRTHWGLISQDVEDVMNELGIPSTDFAGFIKSPKFIDQEKENGERESVPVEGEFTYGLRYDEFIAPMITTIQYLLTEVDMLKQQLKTLRKDVENITQRETDADSLNN